MLLIVTYRNRWYQQRWYSQHYCAQQKLIPEGLIRKVLSKKVFQVDTPCCGLERATQRHHNRSRYREGLHLSCGSLKQCAAIRVITSSPANSRRLDSTRESQSLLDFATPKCYEDLKVIHGLLTGLTPSRLLALKT